MNSRGAKHSITITIKTDLAKRYISTCNCGWTAEAYYATAALAIANHHKTHATKPAGA